MEIEYFDLLSPTPVHLEGVGNFVSPKLRDIAVVGYNNYRYFINIIMMSVKEYFTMLGLKDKYENLADDEKFSYSIFELLTANEQTRAMLEKSLGFFLYGTLSYSADGNCFLTKLNDTETGKIDRKTFPRVRNLIARLNYVKAEKEDSGIAKSKKALEIMKKLQKGRSKNKEHTKADANLELGNIISAVANKHNSLNIVNIWDLTVFQIWDCFARLSTNDIYNIQSMGVATWGDESKTFDSTTWFKKIDM